MEGTETGWGRPAEPAPRWRALLDRALTGSRTGEQPPVPPAGAGRPQGDQPSGRASVGHASVGQPPPGKAQAPPPADPYPPGFTADPYRPAGPYQPVDPYQAGDRYPPGPPADPYAPHPAAGPYASGSPAAPYASGSYASGSPADPYAAAGPYGAVPADPYPSAASLGQQLRDGPSLGQQLRDAPSLGEQLRGEPSLGQQLRDEPSSLGQSAPGQPPMDRSGSERPQAARSLFERVAPDPSPVDRPLAGQAPPGPYLPSPAQARHPLPTLAPSPPAPAPPLPAPAPPAPPLPAPAPPLPGQPRSAPPSGQPLPSQPPPGRAQTPPNRPYSGPPVPAQPPAAPAVPGQPPVGQPPGRPRVAPQPTPDGRMPGYGGQLEWRQQLQPNGVEEAVAVLRRDLGRPRVLAFANPKGGVHKTTATVLAAATIGSVRGRGVLAWDDNELRGTLGLRAGSARHARTIRHLIADLLQIEACHGEELLDRLDDYLRHASDGSYDVLAGEENPRFAQRLDQRTVRRVLELLCRTHDVICIDTGNNVESTNWQTVMQACDQLVITTVPREDAAFTADWMLDLLHDVGLGSLVENAVTLLSCPTPGRSPLLDDLVKHFRSRTRAVAVVPYDPTLESGSSIEYPQLHQETKNAWLRAAGVMLEPFAQ